MLFSFTQFAEQRLASNAGSGCARSVAKTGIRAIGSDEPRVALKFRRSCVNIIVGCQRFRCDQRLRHEIVATLIHRSLGLREALPFCLAERNNPICGNSLRPLQLPDDLHAGRELLVCGATATPRTATIRTLSLP